MLRKDQKYKHISARRNEPNEPNEPNELNELNGAEEYCPFSETQRPLEKDHPPRACCRAPGECCLVLECDEILQGGYFMSEFVRDFIIAQR
jgi:hypothetical protein